MILTLENTGPKNPWVARITGRDPKYVLAREFLAGQVKWQSGSSYPNSGHVLRTTYDLPAGLYEVSAWGPREVPDRYFLVVGGQKGGARVTMPQVMAILEGKSDPEPVGVIVREVIRKLDLSDEDE